MSVQTTTHLNFRGQARQALEHYRSVFGGELTIFTSGQAQHPADTEDGAEMDQVKWGQVQAPSGFRVMAFDVPPGRAFERGQDAVFVPVRGDDTGEVTSAFEALAEGGRVRTALGPAGFSPLYGMVTDRLGITWVMDVAARPAG